MRPASDAELATVHGKGLVETVRRAAAEAGARERAAATAAMQAAAAGLPPPPPPAPVSFTPDTYANPGTDAAARLAAGACIDAAAAVAAGSARAALAIVRPPGHHAESNTAQVQRGTGRGWCGVRAAALGRHHPLPP